MTPRCKQWLAWTLIFSVLLTGCAPMQPYYIGENCELADYLDVSTDIEYPDVCHPPLDEVVGTLEPQTVANPDFDSFWDISLQEVVHTALQNAKIVRDFGQVRQFGQIAATAPGRLVAPQGVATIYDVAIQEAGQNGVEQALSRFDAVFNSQTTWDRTDRPQNFAAAQVNAVIFQQDQVNNTNELSKLTAGGAQLFLRNVNIYTAARNQLTANTRILPSDWFTAIEAEMRQPLLRGRGAQVNRAAVVIARMRSDQAIIDFENSVQEMLNSVERAYWELYFFYHNLETARLGRDTALGIWQRIRAQFQEGTSRGSAQAESQAREQYFFFKSRMHDAVRDLQKSQIRLRYLMGLSPTDGRMLRPSDQPTTAHLRFDWCSILEEGVIRTPPVRRQKWSIKQRELELIAARNQLLPQFDAIALYRWLGVGDVYNNSQSNIDFPLPGSQAVKELFNGDSQEFRLGAEFEIPVGMRAAMAQVRTQQLSLAREKARLEDMELEVTHQLSDAIMDLDAGYQLVVDSFDRLNAAESNVAAADTAYDAGTGTLDLLLDAHRRRAEAAIAYYQGLVNYNVAIMVVHFRKGSLLDYDNVMLAEGPWPAKAYFDATNRARQRSASHYLNYGFTRPGVISRGPVEDNLPPSRPPEVFGSEDYQTSASESEIIEPEPYNVLPEDPSGDFDSLERVPAEPTLQDGGLTPLPLNE
ncbi:MAG: TolC family protein, partial [Planctomycetota bacterium]